MPSASLQSRIRAFEALSSSPSTTMTAAAPSLSTPTANNRTPSSSLLESPISPTASTFHPIAPLVTPVPSNSSRSPSPSTPSSTSLIDLKDWIVEDGPVESPSFRRSLATGVGKLNGIPESSRTPSPSRKAFLASDVPNSSAPLIHFDPPPKPRPPLPPRKPSNITHRTSTQRATFVVSENDATSHPSGRSESLTVEHTYPPGAPKFGTGRAGHTSASSISSFHTVSLSDGSNVDTHSPRIGSKPPSSAFEADSSATDIDTASITESFENVSAPSAASSSRAISFDSEQGISKPKTSSKLEPPGLPNRPATKVVPAVPLKPLARSVSASSSSTATSTRTRRPPPPPPPPPPYQPRSRPSSSRASVVSTSASTSDRSSILSSATTTSRTSVSTRNSAQPGGSVKSSPLLRPTPVPPAARSRYESLFDSAVQGRRKVEKRTRKTKLLSPPPPTAKRGRQAAGWRGLSVDLINPEDHPVLSSDKGPEESNSEEEDSFPVGPEEKLNGRIVKYIWSASRLDQQKLKSIWHDCDPQCTGFIDRDAFIRGMWRIDEELWRAQLARRTSALTAASSQRIPHRPLPPSRLQGTAWLLT